MMIKRLVIVFLAIVFVVLTVGPVSAAVCRTYPYCKLVPGSVDLYGSVVTKYANNYDVAITLIAHATPTLPLPGPTGWVDYGTPGDNDSLSVCRNPGDGGWTPPGQNPGPADTTFSGFSILYYIPKNGKTVAYVNGLTEQPINITDYCPNSNWYLDIVKEYLSDAKIQEIIILENADGSKTCLEASNATLNQCYVDLHDVSWDSEQMQFTGPAYECLGEEALTIIKDPFETDADGIFIHKIDCPGEIQ